MSSLALASGCVVAPPVPPPAAATARVTEPMPPFEVRFEPERQAIPDAAVFDALRGPIGCSTLDLETWRTGLERGDWERRLTLLAQIGLTVTDDDDTQDVDPAAHPELYVRDVRIHDVELGGPPGIERVVEVDLSGGPKLDTVHAHSLAQVLFRNDAGALCPADERGFASVWVGEQRPAFAFAGPKPSWGPQELHFIELLAAGVHAIEVRWATGSTGGIPEALYTVDYWALDEHGELAQIFGIDVYHRRVNSEAELQIVEVEGELRILPGEWPAALETEERMARQWLEADEVERLTARASWVYVDGIYARR